MKYIILILLCSGCTLVSNDRVFPKATWYWSAEAKQQRKPYTGGMMDTNVINCKTK